MPNADYIETIRDYCELTGAETLVGDSSILLAIVSAIRRLQNVRPQTDEIVIRLRNTYAHKLVGANTWSNNNSDILSIIAISNDPDAVESEVRDVAQQLKLDMYRLVYIDREPWIKFCNKFSGTYKVKYSYFETEIDAFDEVTKGGLLYVAAGNICTKLAAKYAKVFDKQMQYDEASMKKKSADYRDLADDYHKIGFDMLNIDEKTGSQAYSIFANWQYLERRVRRYGI